MAKKKKSKTEKKKTKSRKKASKPDDTTRGGVEILEASSLVSQSPGSKWWTVAYVGAVVVAIVGVFYLIKNAME